jgi:hypothetical protein
MGTDILAQNSENMEMEPAASQGQFQSYLHESSATSRSRAGPVIVSKLAGRISCNSTGPSRCYSCRRTLCKLLPFYIFDLLLDWIALRFPTWRNLGSFERCVSNSSRTEVPYPLFRTETAFGIELGWRQTCFRPCHLECG